MFTTYKNIIRCNKAQAFKLINLPHRSLQEDCVGYDFALTTTKAIHQRYPIPDQDKSYLWNCIEESKGKNTQ